MMIREIEPGELGQLLRLYTFLHDGEDSAGEASARGVFDSILRDANHHVIVAEEEGEIVASCVLVIVPNLTRNLRPWAAIENVVTHPDYRRRGLATACLDFSRGIAREAGCYKMLLQTSSKDESVHRFYKNAGYNSADKTGFVQWLEVERR